MNIFLVGSTGSTGQEILKKLLNKGHKVNALVRNPDDLSNFLNDGNIAIIKGDIYQPETYRHALVDCDCVISALGTGLSMRKTDIYSRGGQCLLSAMRKSGVKRLITITSASNDPTDPASQGIIMKFFVRPLFSGTFNDMLKWEKNLDNNKDIEWTCIRPASLTKGKEKGNYRIQLDNLPLNGSEISRKDVAAFMVTLIDKKTYIHEKPAIAY